MRRYGFIEWAQRYCADMADKDCDLCEGGGGSVFGPCFACGGPGSDEQCALCGGHGEYPCLCVCDKILKGQERSDMMRATMNRLEDLYRAVKQKEDDELFRINYKKELEATP